MIIDRMAASTLLRVGLVGFLLWNVAQYVVGRLVPATDTIDFGMGALFGASVCLLLIAIARGGARRPAGRS